MAAWILLLFEKAKPSRLFSVLAVLAMLEFLLHLNQKVKLEQNGSSVISSCGAGYYLWLASGVLMVCASMACESRGASPTLRRSQAINPPEIFS
jgi:hypothetical protein